MSLKKEFTLNTAVKADYWKIINQRISNTIYPSEKIYLEFDLALIINEEAKNDKAEPLKKIFYSMEVITSELDMYLPEEQRYRAWAYPKIKEMLLTDVMPMIDENGNEVSWFSDSLDC